MTLDFVSKLLLPKYVPDTIDKLSPGLSQDQDGGPSPRKMEGRIVIRELSWCSKSSIPWPGYGEQPTPVLT